MVEKEVMAAVKSTGVELKKGTGEMEGPDLTQTSEAKERTLLEDIRTTKGEMVPTKMAEEMVEIMPDLVHGKAPTKTSIMQHVMDKVTTYLL